jgi:hypothetical protein
MAILNFNVTIEQGDTWEQEIALSGVDYSTLEGRCDFRKIASVDSPVVASPTVALTPIYETPFDPLNPPDPLPAIVGTTITLSLTAVETKAIPMTSSILSINTTYVYDVFVRDTSTGFSKKVVKGVATINPSVTR